LECPSPFLWELAHNDSLITDKKQYFHPTIIKTAIFQGGADYAGTKGLTRGDMFGSDGTVTVSGAPMRMVTHELQLGSQSHNRTADHRVSNGDVSFRVLDDLNHATLKLSIEEKGEVFTLLKSFLSTSTLEDFSRFQEEQRKANDALITMGFNPGKLFVFRIAPNVWIHTSKTDRPPLIRFDIVPVKTGNSSVPFGWEMNIEDAAPLPGHLALRVAELIKVMSGFHRHSTDKSYNYVIIDTIEVHQHLVSVSESVGEPAGLCIYLDGRPQFAKLIACSLWKDSFGDHLGSYDTMAIFSIT